MSFSNTVDYANRAGRKRPMTFRNIRRLAERAIDKDPKSFIKIIGDAFGLVKFFYNIPTDHPDCKDMAGRLVMRAQARHAELGIEMELPKRPVEGGPPDMERINATPPLVALKQATGDPETWSCPCGYMGLGPVCTKCGNPPPKIETAKTSNP